MRPLIVSSDVELSLQDVVEVAVQGRTVALARSTKRLLAQRRSELKAFVGARENKGVKIYDINTGFGHNVHFSVDDAGLELLQQCLIRSHSSAVGPDADVETIRATMLLRARSLSRGHSSVRPEIVETLLAMLNAGITPAVPRHGSVSASGDLAPLSHIALALLGEGSVYVRGKRKNAAAALGAAGIKKLTLGMKEGLALNNGVQYSTALGILAAAKFDALLKTAAITTALSTQVMLGADTPFREDLHRLRPHAGAQRVAGWIFALMKNSPLRDAHQPHDIDGELQDPYNIRCAAQILGTCAELLDRARATFRIEANSVTDNPIALPFRPGADGKLERFAGQYVDIVSGGHFHGMPVAVDLYGLVQASAIVATLVNLRCARFVDASRNKGLGSDLKWPGDLDRTMPAGKTHPKHEELKRRQSVSSALMIPEYATASLANAIWGLAMPSHLFSIPTDAGQEDHVSMAANVGLRLHDALARLADALAIELAFGYQAAMIRREMRGIPSRAPVDREKSGGKRREWIPLKAAECELSPVSEEVLDEIGKHFKVVTQDRSLSGELAVLAREVLEGSFVRRAERAGMRF